MHAPVHDPSDGDTIRGGAAVARRWRAATRRPRRRSRHVRPRVGRASSPAVAFGCWTRRQHARGFVRRPASRSACRGALLAEHGVALFEQLQTPFFQRAGLLAQLVDLVDDRLGVAAWPTRAPAGPSSSCSARCSTTARSFSTASSATASSSSCVTSAAVGSRAAWRRSLSSCAAARSGNGDKLSLQLIDGGVVFLQRRKRIGGRHHPQNGG